MKVASPALLALASPLAAQVPPPVVPATRTVVANDPPPPPAPPSQQLYRWMPGEVRCDGVSYPASAVRRPYTAVGWSTPTQPQPSRTLTFRIDANGRPLGIVAGRSTSYVPYGEDIAPSLASTRFPAGKERGGCRISYALEGQPFASASREDIISQSLTPIGVPLPREGWERINVPGSTCRNAPRPQWLVNVQPDMAKLPAEPGARAWVLLGYDLDAAGKPVNARIVTGTRNAALDEAALTAIARSQQTGGPRVGCLNPYVRGADALPAPEIPDEAALRESQCGRGAWARPLSLTYPEAWRRRGIEGWAVIGYDVAPWGATGNVRVIAAEPAAEFGERAAQIIRGASAAPSPRGTTGCVERVRFRMGPDGEVPAAPPPPPVG